MTKIRIPHKGEKIIGNVLKRKDFGDNIMETSLEQSFGGLNLNDCTHSSDTFTKEADASLHDLQGSSSSCNMACDSYLDENVDRWIHGNTSTEIGVQRSGVPVVQRSTAMSSFNVARVWCVLALALPVFSLNCRGWLCSPSVVLSSAEICLTNLTAMMSRARAHIFRIAQEQVTRNCFAAVMDLILMVYAFGFLLLSMYQAEIIG